MTESRFPRVLRCVVWLVFGFQTITRQHTAKRTRQKNCESLQQIDESRVIGSLCANGLRDEYERISDPCGDDEKDQRQNDPNGED